MNHKRKKSRELSISHLWPFSNKNAKQNKSSPKDNSRKHKYTLSFPQKQSPQILTSFFQPNTTSNISSTNSKQLRAPLNEIRNISTNVDHFFSSDKNQSKQYINERLSEVTQKKILPFLGEKLNSLQKNFRSQLGKFQKKINEQDEEIKSLKQENQSLREQILKDKKDIGTSPIKDFEISSQMISERGIKLESLDHLNYLLQMLSTSIQEENIKKEERMGIMQAKIEKVQVVNQQYIDKLTNITQTFNDNFMQLDEKLSELDNSFQNINKNRIPKNVKKFIDL